MKDKKTIDSTGKNQLVIDLSGLESDPRFRAAYFYYLQLANTYIAQIFFQTFNDGKRRKQLYEWLEACKKDRDWTRNTGISQMLFNNIVPGTNNKRSGYLDVYDADFAVMLKKMATGLPGAEARFFRNLNHFHAIPRGRKNFIEDLNALRLKRHYLKDYQRKKTRDNLTDDNKVIYALGLLLLPKLHQHFIGEINRANARAKHRGGKRFCDPKSVQYKFGTARKNRVEATRHAFSMTKKGKIIKKLRRDAEQAKQAFMKQYLALYPKDAWPRYNYHQFRIRIAFIGTTNMTGLEKLLNDKAPHFSRDIEPLYNTAMAINSILNETFITMHELDEREIERLRTEKNLPKKKAWKELESRACLGRRVRNLRNHIAHNGLFCFYQPQGQDRTVPVKEVFSLVFEGLNKPHNPNAREQIGEIYSRISALLDKQNVCWAFLRKPENNSNNPPIVIKRWTKAKRQEYLNFNKWRLDRRKEIRHVCAQWKRSLQQAKDLAMQGHSGM